jgi:hypothetical protein
MAGAPASPPTSQTAVRAATAESGTAAFGQARERGDCVLFAGGVKAEAPHSFPALFDLWNLCPTSRQPG